MTATARIVEFPGEAPELVGGLCVHPDDPPMMLGVTTPYMDVRKRWLHDMAGKGLWVAVAFGADGEKQRLAECVPIEWAAEPVSGDGSLFINCLWVLPRYWRTGVGRALMEYVIGRAANDGSGRGAGDITVLAYEKDRWFGYFSYMPAGFFRRFGFSEVDRNGSRVLLHLDLGGAHRPSLLRPRMRADVLGMPTRHVVEVLYSSQCPWSGWMIDGMRNHIGKLDVEVRLVNTDDRAVVEECGMTRGVCVDGQPLIARPASGREVVRAVKRRLEEATCRRRGINVKFEVMKEHRSNYPNPIALLKGQVVIVGERYDGPENWNGWVYCRTTCGTQEGWVPEQIIRGRGDTGLIFDDYTARELDADIGEKVLGLRELNGWIWCEKATGGDASWLPASNLRPLP